jgi:hypothetical protein
MDELARGWAIMAGTGPGAAVTLVLLVTSLVAIAVGMWLAMRAQRRKAQETDLTPLRRTLPPRASERRL